ncbi:MAG TPA: DUF1761 domain-containing protein [Myxococcota bacterium]|nr:DUF1761 domain-containing protein [Myxococcota bacterium]
MPNYPAAVAASLVTFFVGAPWYSKALFLSAWEREAHAPPRNEAQEKHAWLTFVVAYFASFVAACVLSVHLGSTAGVVEGTREGLLVGVGFVATSFAINYSFANRSAVLWAIDAGYHVLQFVLLGAVLGAANQFLAS